MRALDSPCSQMRRVVSLPSAASYCARTSQRSRSAVPSGGAVSPTLVRTVAASGPGSRSADSQARSRRWVSAHSSRSRTGQPGPEPGIVPSSRTRPASPGACASTMRAAVSSHSPGPDRSAAARPPRSRSASRCSNSCAPAVIRAARRSARRRAASGSAGPESAAVPAASARPRRAASHSSAQSGAAACPGPAGRPPSAQSSSSPSACLHGNFRLGQLQWYAGPVVSTTVRYGVLPLPLHRPQTAPRPPPAPDHGPAVPSLLPALREASSGASAST
ncbi:hypothetical protein GCM10019017_32790 [Streptomyces showdoensis]